MTTIKQIVSDRRWKALVRRHCNPMVRTVTLTSALPSWGRHQIWRGKIFQIRRWEYRP